MILESWVDIGCDIGFALHYSLCINHDKIHSFSMVILLHVLEERQEDNRTCLEMGCIRSFHEQQNQKESEMKGLILITGRLH